MTTAAGDLAEIRATNLSGQPALGGRLRAEMQGENEFVGLQVKGGSWPTYFEGSGRTNWRVVVNAVDVGTDDPVGAEIKAAFHGRSSIAVDVEMATGDAYSGDWMVQRLTLEATSADVQRIDFTLIATGPVAHTVA